MQFIKVDMMLNNVMSAHHEKYLLPSDAIGYMKVVSQDVYTVYLKRDYLPSLPSAFKEFRFTKKAENIITF